MYEYASLRGIFYIEQMRYIDFSKHKWYNAIYRTTHFGGARHLLLLKELNMIIPMATAPQPVSLYTFMELFSFIALVFVIVRTVIRVRGQLKHFKQTKTGLSWVFVWISTAVLFGSVLLYTIGPDVSMFLTDHFGVPYFQTVLSAFVVFLIGVTFMLSAGIIAYLMREDKPKDEPRPKPDRPTKFKRPSLNGSQEKEQEKPAGIRVPSDANR